MLSFAFGLGNVLSFTDRFRVAAWRGTLAKRFASSVPPPHNTRSPQAAPARLPKEPQTPRTAPMYAFQDLHRSAAPRIPAPPASRGKDPGKRMHTPTARPKHPETKRHRSTKKDGLRKIGDRPCVASCGPRSSGSPEPRSAHYLFSSASAAFAGSSAGPAVTLPNAAMACGFISRAL